MLRIIILCTSEVSLIYMVMDRFRCYKKYMKLSMELPRRRKHGRMQPGYKVSIIYTKTPSTCRSMLVHSLKGFMNFLRYKAKAIIIQL